MLFGTQTTGTGRKRLRTISFFAILGVLATALATLLALNLAATCAASRRARAALLEAADTVLACVLLAALLAIVLGLPLGASFLAYKGARHFLSSLLANPWVATRLAKAGEGG